MRRDRDPGRTLGARASRARGAIAAIAAVLVSAGAVPAAADCARGLETTFIPLPVWATLPNEGNTWGALPVFVRVCPEDKRTEQIIAPSVTWNSVIHYTGTVRWYYYPRDDTSLTVIGSASTRINYNGLVAWQHLPTAPGAWTDEVTVRVERSAFRRFFGLGPDTPETAETSYTGRRLLAVARGGINLARHLNLGAIAGIERDDVEARGVPGLPLSSDAFSAAPGIRGATLAWQGLTARYDSRNHGDYAAHGLRAEVTAAVVEGISGGPSHLRAGAQVSGIVRELAWLSGAARLYWSAVSTGQVPFYQQSRLGGELLLRGFTEDRFIDRQAWSIDVEQRIRLLETHIFGVDTEWRVDPFVSAGQVFGGAGEALSNPRLAVGAGLRAFVHPNVLGRIDLASGGEGLKVYVELGYPY